MHKAFSALLIFFVVFNINFSATIIILLYNTFSVPLVFLMVLFCNSLNKKLKC